MKWLFIDCWTRVGFLTLCSVTSHDCSYIHTKHRFTHLPQKNHTHTLCIFLMHGLVLWAVTFAFLVKENNQNCMETNYIKKKDLALAMLHISSNVSLLSPQMFFFIFNLHNKVKKNVKSSIYCGFQLWYQGSATWEKEEGVFFLWDSHTAQHLGVPREPLNATEPHTAVANMGNKQITLTKQKKGLFFLTKISTQQKIR